MNLGRMFLFPLLMLILNLLAFYKLNAQLIGLFQNVTQTIHVMLLGQTCVYASCR